MVSSAIVFVGIQIRNVMARSRGAEMSGVGHQVAVLIISDIILTNDTDKKASNWRHGLHGRFAI